jgi:carbohydrate kinase (thermoresistant glucokinase family)
VNPQQTREGSPRQAIVVLMGVAGSGKSTIGRLLAAALHCDFREGDTKHPPANIEKMKNGIPLTEADRLPWLRGIAAAIDYLLKDGQSAVLSCSALKRNYRDIIIGTRPHVVLVYLKGSFDLIRARIEARQGHFMPASLLRSQFDTLEEPAPQEHAITVDIGAAPAEIVRRIRAGLESRLERAS